MYAPICGEKLGYLSRVWSVKVVIGNRLSKKNLTTPCALSLSSKRLALFRMPSDVTSSPLVADVRSASSGGAPQNRYDKRLAISSLVGRRRDGWLVSAT